MTWSFALKLTIFLMYFFSPLIVFSQKSYTKKGRARAAAKQKLANEKLNGHITHDINHNETKPVEEKKEK